MAERGIYRSIPCALLAGKDFRALPERARWIFVVLKMNIGAVGIDTWYPDELISRLASESGAKAEQVRTALDILERKGWLAREDNIVWLKGHITHDPHLAAENKLHRKSVQRHLAGLPRNAIVRDFVKAHPEWCPAEELSRMGMSWVSNGYQGGSEGLFRTFENPENTGVGKGEGKGEGETATPPASGEAVDNPFAFMGRINAVHREFYGGEPPKGTATALAPLVAALGVDDLEARFRVYCQKTQAAYVSIPKFARSWKAYSPEPAAPRLIGVGGEPTPEELASIGIRLA